MASTQEAITSIPDIEFREQVPLAQYTGFRTGGCAAHFAIPHTKESFLNLIQQLRAQKQPFYILGNGSNVLAPDTGYAGWVVKTDCALQDIQFADDNTVCAGAGVTLAELCKRCAAHGLTGLEFAYGIPGTVGGAIFMNAGAYDGEMKDVVVAAEVLSKTGAVGAFSNNDLAFGYRTSAVQNDGCIVLSATFLLRPDDPDAIRQRMTDLLQRRKEKQPLDLPSCGSTFKRPAGAYASKLIDDCGLRGFSVGGAAVSEKHCGFVVNTGGATTADVLEVIRHVQETVKIQTGFALEPEIRLLGD